MDGNFDIESYLGVKPKKPKKTKKTRPSSIGRWADKINYYATASNLDPDLISRMTTQESGGKKNAKSWAGNAGLMQVSQAVVNRFVKKREFGTLNPYNPDVNLAAGTRYMKFLMDRYGGDYKRALAGYNAGEGNADKNDWWRQSKRWSNSRKVQKGLLPRGYKYSTREYIDKITAGYSPRGQVPNDGFDIEGYLGVNTPTQESKGDDFDVENYLGLQKETDNQPAPSLGEGEPKVNDVFNGQISSPSVGQQSNLGTEDFKESFPTGYEKDTSTRDRVVNGQPIQDVTPTNGEVIPKPSVETQVELPNPLNGKQPTVEQPINVLPTNGGVIPQSSQPLPSTQQISTQQIVQPSQPIQQQAIDPQPVPQNIGETPVATNGQTYDSSVQIEDNTDDAPIVDDETGEVFYGDGRVDYSPNQAIGGLSKQQSAIADVATHFQNKGIPYADTEAYLKTQGFRNLDDGTTSRDVGDFFEYTNEEAKKLESYSKQRTAIRDKITQDLLERGTQLTDADLANLKTEFGFTDDELTTRFRTGLNQEDFTVDDKFQDARKKGQDTFNAYLAEFERIKKENPTKSDAYASIIANVNTGRIPESAKERLLAEEREAEKAFRAEHSIYRTGRSAEPDKPQPSSIRFANNDQLEASIEASIQDALKASGGSFTQIYKDREIENKLHEKYKFRPLARPLQAARNFYAAVPQAVSSILKTVNFVGGELNAINLAQEFITGKDGYDSSKGYLTKIGEDIEKLYDEVLPKNKEFEGEVLTEFLPAILSNASIQGGLAILSGGTTLPVAFGFALGASEQLEEARSSGATQNQTRLAGIAGGAFAISDAIPLGFALKPLKKTADKVGFINNLTSHIFTKTAKEVGEKQAIDLSKGFLVRALKNSGIFAKGALLEGGQELAEKKANDLLARITYDPKRKILEISAEDVKTFLGGTIGGTVFGGIRLKLEQSARANETSQILENELSGPRGWATKHTEYCPK